MKNQLHRHTARIVGTLGLLLLATGLIPLFGQASVLSLISAQDSMDNDLVMLVADNDNFGNFAAAGSRDNANSRLVVSFAEAGETVHLGLSREFDLVGDPLTGTAGNYRVMLREILVDGTLGGAVWMETIDGDNFNVTDYADVTFPYEGGADGRGDIHTFTAPAAGDYAIQFEDIVTTGNLDRQNVTIPYWNFTVTEADGTTIIPGRVWSRNWAFRTPPNGDRTIATFCNWKQEFNGNFYSYTDDGFVSEVDFDDSGFQGLTFSIAFNSFGPRDSEDLTIARQSVEGNATSSANTAEHRVFLELPDEELFPSGDCGTASVSGPFQCAENEEFCLPVTTSQVGQVELILDFNNDGDIDSTDVVLLADFDDPDNLTQCIPWDGNLANGQPVMGIDSVNIVINYVQGVQHYSAFDVELLTRGFSVSTIRPACAASSVDTLFYDDRNVYADGNQVFPIIGNNDLSLLDGRDGCAGGSSNNCRTWNNFSLGDNTECRDVRDDETSGFGNRVTLNTYWFARRVSFGLGRFPIISAVILGPETICEGDTATFTVQDTTLGTLVAYNWSASNGGTIVSSPTGASINAVTSGTYCVTVTSSDNCNRTTCTDLDVIDGTLDLFEPELRLCAGESGTLETAGPEDLIYQWTPTTGISDPTSNNPTFTVSETTVYTVTISSVNSGTADTCRTQETVTVFVFPDLNLVPGGGGPICDETITFSATTDVAATVTLSDNDNGDQLLQTINIGAGGGTGNFSALTVSGTSNYTLIAEDGNGCRDTAFVMSQGGPVDFRAPGDTINCGQTSVALTATNLDPNDNPTFSWAPADLFQAGTTDDPTAIFTAGPGVYQVTVTATNQVTANDECSDDRTLQVVVLPAIETLDFTATTNCTGTTVRLRNPYEGQLDVIYDLGDGQTRQTDELLDYTYAVAGTYIITARFADDDIDCVREGTRTVTVAELSLQAGFTFDFDDENGCTDSGAEIDLIDATFNATGGPVTYAWTFTNAVPASSAEASPTILATESGIVTATLVVTTGAGPDICSDTLTQNIEVGIVMVPLRDTTICPDGEASLNPLGDQGLSYTWSPAPDFDPNDPNPTTQVAGTYSVTVTANAADVNCPFVGEVEISIADSIGLSAIDINGNIVGDTDGDGDVDEDDEVDLDGDGVTDLPTLTSCGEPTDLTINLENPTGVTVVFTSPDGTVLGTGLNFSFTATGNDTIIITATNSIGCPESTQLVVRNQRVDADIDAGIEGVDVCQAQDTSVSVVNNNPDDVLTYQWTPNDAINGPLDGPTVNVTAAAEGSIPLEVIVTNQFGCADTLTTSVNTIPFIPAIYPDTVTVCGGQRDTLRATSMAGGDYTYQWIPSEGLDLSDPANPSGVFTEDTEFTVIITDELTMCSDTQMVFVDASEEIGLEVTPSDGSVCGPSEFTLFSTAANPDFVITYSLDRDFGNVIGTGDRFDFVVNEETGDVTIFIRAVDGETGCDEITSVTINYVPFMPPTYDPVQESCFGDQVTLTSTGELVDGYTYTWSPAGELDDPNSANPSGTFSDTTQLMVIITDPQTMCADTQDVQVNVAPDVELMASPTDTTLCEPGSVVVTGGSGNDNVDLVWYADADATQQVGTGPTFTVEADAADQQYNVFLVGTDATTQCADTIPVTVNVTSITISTPPPTVAGCGEGENTRIGLITGGIDRRFTYTYSPAASVDDSDPDNPVYIGTEDGTVTVTIFDPETECMIMRDIAVNVINAGPISGTARDTLIILGNSNELTVTGCDECDYEWEGNGTITFNNDNGSSVTVEPTASGEVTYTVTGTVMEDGVACPTTTTITFRVEDPDCDPERIWLPNAFSPNGDMTNDRMRVRLPTGFEEEISYFRWIIYDRWGQEVFSTDDVTDFWDGTTEGDDLEPDVYGYWLQVECPSQSDTLTKQGNITILR